MEGRYMPLRAQTHNPNTSSLRLTYGSCLLMGAYQC
jgi:hypothetical protein